MEKIDTLNKFMVGAQGHDVVIANPPSGPMSADEALALAAWLACMAEIHTETKFEDVLNAVQNS